MPPPLSYFVRCALNVEWSIYFMIGITLNQSVERCVAAARIYDK